MFRRREKDLISGLNSQRMNKYLTNIISSALVVVLGIWTMLPLLIPAGLGPDWFELGPFETVQI
jgi:hypothetical protein